MNQKLVRFARISYQPLIRLGFAFVIAFLVTRFQFDYIEALLYDGRMRLRPAPTVSGHITTVAIDPKTIDRLHRAPDAKDHTRLLERMLEQKPKAVMYLIHPSELVGSYEELKAWAETAAQVPGFVIAVDDVPMKGAEEAFRLSPPFESLKADAAPSTSDRNLFARDVVTRRMFTSYQGQTFLHVKLAALFNPKIRDENRIHGIFDFLDARQVFIDFRPAGSYPVHSFIDGLEGRWQKDDLRNKIVIVGRDLRTTVKDYIRTPYSREINAMTAIEMHANMLDTLILNNGYYKLPDWVNIFLTTVISILTVYVVLALKPTRGLLLLGGSVLSFSLLSYLLFWWGTIWVVMAHPLLAAFICYYFFIPYRLIMENRKSWEYLQKNRLLTQVEELKTNFLSMMSHDLKTPIARIQGMTDIVLKDPTPLSERQREALQTLEKSSHELLDFVTSILNLGRIESKELRLHLQSKDPNQLIQEIAGKFEYLAKSKNISLMIELEPMFSIKMDVDLIRQVIANLVENAIKYSPEGTRILVSTEEAHGRVVIQVADQGPGILEDEIGQVFSKFYRSKDAKYSNIKGSGLGLYLAKYFVELHKGTISVDSAPGAGSTFTVELPTDLQEP
ncbi:MAG: CHASE2 and HATPase_c domain-containing protein [Bdellovibrionaceae bacterium]|nr:CHASE2 and HATPase_c domain-containing protein [Pseudobdellovibrionaceae bacterium]